MESVATLQKLNLDMSNLVEEEARVKTLQDKLEKSIKTVYSDLEREKSITLDADLNEKRILKERGDLLNSESKLLDIETNSLKELQISKAELNSLQDQLDDMLNQIEIDIDNGSKLSKTTFQKLKSLVRKITLSQESYAEKFGKNKSIESDLLKERKELKILI